MRQPQSLADAVGRMIDDDEPSSPDIFIASLRLSARYGDDPRGVLKYLTDLGAEVGTLDDLSAALTTLPDEEELSAVCVSEGLLIQHASDGWFLLYVA